MHIPLIFKKETSFLHKLEKETCCATCPLSTWRLERRTEKQLAYAAHCSDLHRDVWRSRGFEFESTLEEWPIFECEARTLALLELENTGSD